MEPRNVRLGHALDGMNPFTDLSIRQFYMACDDIELQSSSVVSDKQILCHVVIGHPREGVNKISQY